MAKKESWILTRPVFVEVNKGGTSSRERRETGASVDDLDAGQIESMRRIGMIEPAAAKTVSAPAKTVSAPAAASSKKPPKE